MISRPIDTFRIIKTRYLLQTRNFMIKRLVDHFKKKIQNLRWFPIRKYQFLLLQKSHISKFERAQI